MLRTHEAPVAEITPGISPSSTTKLNASRMPNFGTRLNPTPTMRGPSPDSDALTGLARNAAFASWEAIFGSTTLPAPHGQLGHTAAGGIGEAHP